MNVIELAVLVLLAVIDLLALVKIQEVKELEMQTKILRGENTTLRNQIFSNARNMSTKDIFGTRRTLPDEVES